MALYTIWSAGRGELQGGDSKSSVWDPGSWTDPIGKVGQAGEHLSRELMGEVRAGDVSLQMSRTQISLDWMRSLPMVWPSAVTWGH